MTVDAQGPVVSTNDVAGYRIWRRPHAIGVSNGPWAHVLDTAGPQTAANVPAKPGATYVFKVAALPCLPDDADPLEAAREPGPEACSAPLRVEVPGSPEPEAARQVSVRAVGRSALCRSRRELSNALNRGWYQVAF